MEVIEREILYKRSLAERRLYAFGDMHGGTIHCTEHDVERKVGEIHDDHYGLWLGMGDYCMPLQAKILTKDGFKNVSQLSIGELVAAYDNGKLRWTPLLKIYQSPSLPMIELKSKSFYAKCTPNHAWLVSDRHKDRASYGKVERKLASDLKKHHGIVVCAPLEEKTKPDIKLTETEAALLGWIVTDGHIRTNPVLNVSICQSKEPYKTMIRLRFSDWFTKEYKQTFDNGFLDKSTFNIKVGKIRKLFATCKVRPGNIKVELPYIVTRIDAKARMAMIEAMVQAEGWMERDKWHFSQKEGKVFEAFQILATLCGFRMGLPSPNKDGVLQVSFIRQTPVDVANLKITELPCEPAWCPSTQYGSWVYSLNGQVAITGNCEFITPSDPRWDGGGVAEWVDKEDIGYSQEKWVINLLKPIKDKCIGMLYGNHEQSIFRHSHQNVHKHITDALGVRNLGYSAFIKLSFRRENSKEAHDVKGAFTHGAGCAITEGAKMNNLMRFMKSFDADIYGYGHVHDYIPKSFTRLGINSRNKIVNKVAIGATTGSWFRTYTQGIHSSYGETKCYPPNELCCAMFTINPQTGHLDVRRSV